MTINIIRKKGKGNNKPLRTSPYPSKDLTNKKINRLLVMRFEEYRPNKRGVRKCYYRCKCDCGNEAVISHQELTHGRISCGCALDEFRKNILPQNAKAKFSLPYGEAAFNDLYARYKEHAKRVNVIFSLSKDEFRKLSRGNCFYCGIEPLQEGTNHRKGRGNGSYIHNGIDRKDNNRGYELNNVVSCCGICNKAKRDLPMDTFLKWIEQLIHYRDNKLLK